MLVLSRMVGESIVIGDGVQVMVLGIRNGKVRLGVTAPADVPVHREEILARIAAARSAQSTAGGTNDRATV